MQTKLVARGEKLLREKLTIVSGKMAEECGMMIKFYF